MAIRLNEVERSWFLTCWIKKKLSLGKMRPISTEGDYPLEFHTIWASPFIIIELYTPWPVSLIECRLFGWQDSVQWTWVLFLFGLPSVYFLPLKANSLFGLISFHFYSFRLAGGDFLLTYCTNKMDKQFSGCQLLIFSHQERLCWVYSGGLKTKCVYFVYSNLLYIYL